MKNPYDEIIQKDIESCNLLLPGQSLEECCLANGIEECPDNPLRMDKQEYSYAPLLYAAVLLGVLIAIAWTAWRKRAEICSAYSSISETKKALLSGWLIWAFLVCSVIALFEPYGVSMSSEEIASSILWVTLPPMFVILAKLWHSRFVSGNRKF